MRLDIDTARIKVPIEIAPRWICRKAPAGFFFEGLVSVAALDGSKRVIAFFDGQNLYHAAREAFQVSHPNFDVFALANTACPSPGYYLKQIRFYSGVPSADEDPRWNRFWQKKLLSISRQGVMTITRPLAYRNMKIRIDENTEITKYVAVEKGIDVRIALDLVRLFFEDQYDAAVIFSQDQDLMEATEEVKQISRREGRPVELFSAYPVGPGTMNKRGINKTTWIQLDHDTDHRCIDQRDYR